jgi:hypothetical protein
LAALLGGFFSRRAARRVRAFSAVRVLDIPYDTLRQFSTLFNGIRHVRQFTTLFDNAHDRSAAKRRRGAAQTVVVEHKGVGMRWRFCWSIGRLFSRNFLGMRFRDGASHLGCRCYRSPGSVPMWPRQSLSN